MFVCQLLGAHIFTCRPIKMSKYYCKFHRFNLSTYPFLNSVPDADDIDFKCDGLHDGFYASIKYSCQVWLYVFHWTFQMNGFFSINPKSIFNFSSFIIIVCMGFVMISCVPILLLLIRNHSSVILCQRLTANRPPNTGSGNATLADFRNQSMTI